MCVFSSESKGSSPIVQISSVEVRESFGYRQEVEVYLVSVNEDGLG